VCWNVAVPGMVTISATFGARGDRIARAVADRLGLPFLDRAMPLAPAPRLDLPGGLAESLDDPLPSRWARIVQAFANTAAPVGPAQVPMEITDPVERLRATSESLLEHLADGPGGVVLGRAAMVVLGGRPDTLCVRLDGPLEARVANAVAAGVEEDSARHGQRVVDGARDAYARVLYDARQDDLSLYHLVVDSTALSVDACVGIIVRGAWDRFGVLAQ
jgi:hypothetical protein